MEIKLVNAKLGIKNVQFAFLENDNHSQKLSNVYTKTEIVGLSINLVIFLKATN